MMHSISAKVPWKQTPFLQWPFLLSFCFPPAAALSQVRRLGASKPHNLRQTGPFVRAKKTYTGSIVLSGTPGTVFKIALSYFIGAEQWTGEIHVPQTIESAVAQGAGKMIVVLPDSETAHLGSFYSSSAAKRNFERFISQDLVAYIDAHYRTLPKRESRGLMATPWADRRLVYGHEAPRCVWRPIHDQSLLPVVH